MEAGLSAEDCLKLTQTDPHFANETGLSPEAEVTLMLQTLENTDQVINDYQGLGKFVRSYNSMFASGYVPYAYWDRGGRLAGLGYGGSDDRYDSGGSRSSVRV